MTATTTRRRSGACVTGEHSLCHGARCPCDCHPGRTGYNDPSVKERALPPVIAHDTLPVEILDRGVVWEQPPITALRLGTPGRPCQWPIRLAPLIHRPGHWARVWQFSNRDAATHAAADLRAGRLATPAGTWQFHGGTSDNGDGHFVWARYDGPLEAKP